MVVTSTCLSEGKHFWEELRQHN